MRLSILQLSCRLFFGKASHHPGLSAFLQPRFGSLRLLAFPRSKIAIEREEICECDGHTVHNLIQRRLTTDWLALRESDCSRMDNKVSSDWMPSYVKATRPVLEMFKMTLYFPDSARTVCSVLVSVCAVHNGLPVLAIWKQTKRLTILPCCFVWVWNIVTLREENMLIMLKEFWEKFLCVRGGDGRLNEIATYNVELLDLCSSDICVMKRKRMRLVGHVRAYGEGVMHTGFWGWDLKEGDCVEDKYKSEDNIKLNLKGRVWEGMYWVYLAEDRGKWQAVFSTVMNLRDPYMVDNLWISRTINPSCSNLVF